MVDRVININHFEEMFSENSLDALYYMEIPSGIYKFFSKSVQSIFGYSREEFYNTPLLIKKIIHPNFEEYFKTAWEKLLLGDVPAYYEYQIIDKDSNVKLINQRNSVEKDINGNIIAIRGIITDITHLKFMEDELIYSRKRFDEISQTSSDWVWEVDKDGIYTYVSDRVEDFLGYKAQEIIGKSPFDTMLPQEAKLFHKNL